MRTSGSRDVSRPRRCSDSSSHAARRPDAATNTGISEVAHKCAHSDSASAVSRGRIAVRSNPVLPTQSVCCGSQRFAAFGTISSFWPSDLLPAEAGVRRATDGLGEAAEGSREGERLTEAAPCGRRVGQGDLSGGGLSVFTRSNHSARTTRLTRPPLTTFRPRIHASPIR